MEVLEFVTVGSPSRGPNHRKFSPRIHSSRRFDRNVTSAPSACHAVWLICTQCHLRMDGLGCAQPEPRKSTTRGNDLNNVYGFQQHERTENIQSDLRSDPFG